MVAQRTLSDYVYGTIYKFCHYKYKKSKIKVWEEAEAQ